MFFLSNNSTDDKKERSNAGSVLTME
ncbi:unnamed protein product, partial [Rotaria magnacalcarata]